MLLVFFILFLVLAIAFFYLGGSISSPALQVSGSVLLFLLGGVLLFSSITVESGFTEVYSYEDNLTSSVSVVYDYSGLTNTVFNGVDVEHIIGLLLLACGVFSFVSVFVNIGRFSL